MGIIDRLSTLIRSNINDLISRAENPQKVLEQLIIDMRNQLAKAKQQVAAAIADEKRLSAQAEQEKKLSEDWEKRAVLAVQEGRDDLAKQALLRYNEHVQGAVQLQETWLKHREETEKLKASLRQLNDKIEEAKRKKNILIARQKRAEAHKRIQETLGSISDKSAFETFERMAEQIEHEERKLVAAAEVVGGVRRIAREIGGELVATVGNLVVTPNIVNAIPGRVTLSIDMRDPRDAMLDGALARLEPIVREACEREGVRYELDNYWRVPYTPFDRDVVDTVERAARAAGARHRRIRSGAGHSCCQPGISGASARAIPKHRLKHHIPHGVEPRLIGLITRRQGHYC